jgi:hypothetical protein
MTAVSGKMYAYGAKECRIWKLNTDGELAAVDTNPYVGVEAVGVRGFNPTFPEPRRLTHYGNMRVLSVAMLPPTDPVTGAITLSRHDFDVHALLSATKVATVGEAKIIHHGHDKVATPQDVCILISQLAKDAATKVTRYRNIILPVTQAFIRPAGASDEAAEFTYDVTANPASKYPWGVALSELNDGCTEAGAIEIMTETPLMLCAWVGDNIVTEFNFPADMQAAATAKIHVVTVNGAADATVAKATDGVTPTAKPGVGDLVVAFYERA